MYVNMGFTKKHLLLLFCMILGFVGTSASSTTPFGDILEALDLYLSNCTVPDLKFPCNPDAGSRHSTCHVKDDYCYRYGDSDHQSLNDCRQCHVPCLGETTVERDRCEKECKFYQYSECKKSQQKYIRNLITNYQDESKKVQEKSVSGHPGVIFSISLNVILTLGCGLLGYYFWRLRRKIRQSEPPNEHDPQSSDPQEDLPLISPSTTAPAEQSTSLVVIRSAKTPEHHPPMASTEAQLAMPEYPIPDVDPSPDVVESEHGSAGSDAPLPIQPVDSGTPSLQVIGGQPTPPPAPAAPSGQLHQEMSPGLAGPLSVGVSPGATGTSDAQHDSAASDSQPLTGEAMEAQDPSGQEPELVTSHAITKR